MKNRKIIWILTIVLALCVTMFAANASAQSADSKTDSTNSPATNADATISAPQEPELENGNDAEAYDPTMTGTYEDGSTPEFSDVKLRLTIDGEEVVIHMYDNTAVEALIERLPLEDLSFFDLSGIEKPIEQLEEPLSLGEEEPGYDPVTGEMVIYRPWANFTIFYGDFRYSPELVPLGKVEAGLEVLSSKTEDFTGTLEIMEAE